MLSSQKETDISRVNWKRKKKAFSMIDNLTIVGVSKWIANCAREGPLFKDRRILNIPNPIETNVFKPVDKIKAREALALPKDKKLVLFGAVNATEDPRKGFKELTKALYGLKREDLELIASEAKNLKTHQNLVLRHII